MKEKNKMNKKYIIGGVVLLGLIVGGVYIYNKRKLAELNKNVVTEKDALEIVALLGQRDTPFSAEQMKAFVPIYVANIKKDTHNEIKGLLNKKESDWTIEDKVTFLTLLQKVINPLKDKLPQPKK